MCVSWCAPLSRIYTSRRRPAPEPPAEIARFWSSIAAFNAERGRYEIRGVMGPDEFHEGYPDSSTPGLNNNAYTNIMAVWVLCRAK